MSEQAFSLITLHNYWENYQQRLVAAARDNDHVAAAAINEESLVDATERIRSLLAAQKVAAQLGAG